MTSYCLPVPLEPRHLPAAQHGLDGPADRIHVDPEQRRLLAVDLDLELRLVELEVAVEVLQPRILPCRRRDLSTACLQHLVGLRGLQHELDRLVDRALAQRGRVGGEREQARDGEQLGEQALGDVLLLDRPLVPVDQPHEVDPLRHAGKADDREEPLDEGRVAEDLLHPLDVVVGVGQRSSPRALCPAPRWCRGPRSATARRVAA